MNRLKKLGHTYTLGHTYKKGRAALIALFLGALVLSLTPIQSEPVSAQVSVEDAVFAIVSRNLGISPAPTKGQLDMGTDDLPFPFRYDTRALDLNASGGAITCNARLMGIDEFITGFVGYRVLVTVQGRRYEFRTNDTGSQMIRCLNGRQVDLTFGVNPTRGASRGGAEIVDLAMRHLSNFLLLDPIITRADVDNIAERRRNGEDTSDYPYRVTYRWDSVVYTNSAFNCPGAGQAFVNGDVAAYRISVGVNGRIYQYRASPDGSVLILCLSGRADPSSVGVTIPG